MHCLNCDKELSNKYHDRKVMEGLPPMLHVHCYQCDTVFVIHKNSSGSLEIKRRDVMECNASLIAAAPDLLEALREVSQALEWQAHGGCRGFSDNLLPNNVALDLARAAIAKAEGAGQ